MTDTPPSAPSPQAKQPMLRAPFIVLALLGVLLVFQLLMAFGGYPQRNELLVALGLFPARLFAEGLGGLPGTWVQGLVNLFSYSMLHGGWSHFLLNAVWLLAFGAPVARRLGPRKFMFLYMACTMLAGLGQIYAAPVQNYLIPIIGASGGVAGLMGAASRFAFSDVRWLDPSSQTPERRLLRLSEVPKRRPVLMFIGIWLVMNLAFGLLGPYGMASPDGAPVNIAWIAHLVGFLAGLLLIGFLEKPPLSASGGPGQVGYGEWKNRKK